MPSLAGQRVHTCLNPLRRGKKLRPPDSLVGLTKLCFIGIKDTRQSKPPPQHPPRQKHNETDDKQINCASDLGVQKSSLYMWFEIAKKIKTIVEKAFGHNSWILSRNREGAAIVIREWTGRMNWTLELIAGSNKILWRHCRIVM